MTDRWPVSTAIEHTARALTPPERRAYLRAAGWHRLGGTWFHPTRDDPGGDRSHYTLAAAIRAALADRTPVLPPEQDCS